MYLPVCIAAEAVTVLKVEPGASVVWTARLSSGSEGSFDSAGPAGSQLRWRL